MSMEKERKCPYCDNETRNNKFCDFCGKPIQNEIPHIFAYIDHEYDYLGKP